MSTAPLTEERLRSWLDTNQVQQERLSIAVLSLDRRYTDVKPRRPKGGPDGSRDIEAIFDGAVTVWGGVGFRKSANDSSKDKRWVAQKFEEDLVAAISINPKLQGFVFFTNVDLTPAEVAALEKSAREKGLSHVDIYYRERMRIALDSPAGLAFRFQYLSIPLSEAEQATFFAMFGSQLEELILRQFSAVDKKLGRIEFLHDCNKQLSTVGVVVVFDRPYSADELGHFRVLARILDLRQRDPHPELCFGARDAYPVHHEGETARKLVGYQVRAWSPSTKEDIQTTILSYAEPTVSQIHVECHVYRQGPFSTLGALEGLSLSVHVTSTITDRIASIGVTANEYLLAFVEKAELMTLNEDPSVEWPDELKEEESSVGWMPMMIRGKGWLPGVEFMPKPLSLDFSAYTPRRFR
jgi:hypothetical protein